MLNEILSADRKDRISQVLIMDEVDGMSGNEDRAGVCLNCLIIIFYDKLHFSAFEEFANASKMSFSVAQLQ